MARRQLFISLIILQVREENITESGKQQIRKTFRLASILKCHNLGAHNLERVTPLLGPCHGAFTDQFIFRHILGHFFPANIESPPRL